MQPTVVCNQFVTRQLNITNSSEFGGFTGSAQELEHLLFYEYINDEYKEGFAPFVRIVELHQKDLSLFRQGFRQAKPGEPIVRRFERRRSDEEPVPVSYVFGSKVEPTEGRLILYSHDQLEKEGEPVTEGSDFEIISINLGPESEPMLPETLWRNYFFSRNPEDTRGKGGSPHFSGKTDAEFLEMLYASYQYWNDRGKIVTILPNLPEEK